MAMLQWLLCEAPGATLWLTRDKEESLVVAKDRINPALDLCVPLEGKLPKSRLKRTTLAIYIMGSLLRIAGAKQLGALQSTPYRYLLLDEARSYPKGALEMVDKRTRSYTHTYKKLIFSTAGTAGDEFDSAYMGGSQSHAHVKCPACGEHQPLHFCWAHDEEFGIKWTENELTKNGDDYSYGELLKTVHWQCKNPECRHVAGGSSVDADTPLRKMFSRECKWVARNEKAPSWYKSYEWNAFLCYWNDWKTLVHEYLEAKKAARWGNWEPLKVFVRESLGMSWSDSMMVSDDEQAITGRQTKYDPSQVPPPPEAIAGKVIDQRRFLTADVQARGGRHFWVVVRHWWRGGESKLIHAGKCYSYDEIKQIAADCHVDPLNIIIDSGYAASEVYAEILKSGRKWKAFKDEDKYSFGVQGVHRVVQPTNVDPAIGTPQQGKVKPLGIWLVAKYGCLDRLTMLMQGSAGNWQFFEGVSDEYIAQITAYQKLPEKDKRGMVKWRWHQKYENDHMAMCECYQVAAAAMTGLIYETPEAPPVKEEPQKPLLTIIPAR